MTIATCKVGDCQNKPSRKGLCQRHYNLSRLGLCKVCDTQPAHNKTGECTDCKKRGGPPPYSLGKGKSYSAAHRAVKKARGFAHEHKCSCGNQAEQWALVNKSKSNPTTIEVVWGVEMEIQYSFNVNDYEAMCRKCHISFDRKGKHAKKVWA